MEDRFLDAMNLVKDRLDEKQIRFINNIINIYETVCNGYMDWNDWEEFYEDKSEEGLEAYICGIFGLDYKPSYWTTEINNSDEAMDEIDKAIGVGTNMADIEDYLDELIQLNKINAKEYMELMEYAKEEIENV